METLVEERATSLAAAEVAAAHDRGDLKLFNSEFRRRRTAARAAGERFMSDAEAMRRLRRELACVAAGRITALMVARVFGEVPHQGGRAAA